jgi:hypothetical protein
MSLTAHRGRTGVCLSSTLNQGASFFPGSKAARSADDHPLPSKTEFNSQRTNVEYIYIYREREREREGGRETSL